MSQTIQSRITRAIAVALIGVTALPGVMTFAATDADQVRDVETHQEQLRTQTQRVAAQIDAVIADFEHNGLGQGQDIDTLKGIRGVLGQLSEKQMQQVIGFLQQARNSADTDASRKDVVQAVAGQQDVVANLRALLTTYKAQQEMYLLAARFGELADRQESNLGTVIDLVQTAAGKKLDQLDASQRDSVGVQQTQETGIKDDTAAALIDLKAAIGKADGKTAQRLTAAMALATDQKLVDTQTSAASELGAGDLYNSAKLQRTSRDALREIERLVTVLEDDDTRLKQASDDLGKAIEAQKKLADASKDAKGDKAKTADADKQQAKLVDKTDTAKKNLEDLSPSAAAKLKAAEDKMQDARLDLRNQKSDPASDKQKDAADQLAAAKAEIDKQIAANDQAKNDPKDKLEETQDLLKQVQAIHKDQDELKSQSASNAAKPDSAAKQADLKKRTDDVQQKAVANTPAAGKDLGDASDQMSKAADAMKGVGSPVVPQGVASDDLGKAEAALKKQADDLQKAKDDLAAVQKAQEDVVALIVAESAIELQTAKAEAMKKNDTGLVEKQSGVADQTLKVKDEVQPQSPPAAAALGDANKNMGVAKSNLEKPAYPVARNSEKESLADLNKAKDLLDQKANDLKNQLGMPPDPAGDLAKAIDAIDKAAQQTADAQNKLDTPDTKDLQAQQQKLADDLKDKAKQDPDNQNLKTAQQDAQKAADELAKNDAAAAAKMMAEAQKAIAAATPTPPPTSQPAAPPPTSQPATPPTSQPATPPTASTPTPPTPATPSAPTPDSPSAAAPSPAAPSAPAPSTPSAAAPSPTAPSAPSAAAPSAPSPASPAAPSPAAPSAAAPSAPSPAAPAAPSPAAPSAAAPAAPAAPPPGLAQLGDKQADLQKQAEALAGQNAAAPAAPAPDPAAAAADAGKQMEATAADLAKMAAEAGAALPQSAQQAVDQAKQDLADAAAKAAAGKPEDAKADAQSAQQALAQAKAAMAMAGGPPKPGGPPGPPKAGPPGPPGSPDGQPSATPGPPNGDPPPPIGTGEVHDTGPTGTAPGAVAGVNGSTGYVALPQRDRQALQQSQADKVPQEYGPMVEQYLRNLSDDQGNQK